MKRKYLLKRVFDIFFSTLILILFSWLILLLWFTSTIIFSKNGLFIQKRIGEHRKTFLIYKIRSLRTFDDLKPNRYSRFIRKYKLDELPQFFNVLLGNMSIVGPRPELLSHFEKKYYPREYFSIKPGVTGLASLFFIDEKSIKKRLDDKSFEKWMYLKKKRINLIYIRNMNFCFDLKIIYITLQKIINL